MLAGDTHGNNTHWQYLINQCVKAGVKIIFQLGDFGYWEHDPYHDKRYLHKLSRMLKRAGIKVYFLDGNHDNHPLLWKKYKELDDEGFVIVRDNIFYSPRGHRWTWNDVTFLSLGGAYSVDCWDRNEGVDWWRETEMVRDSDVNRAIAGGPVDILLTHDAPEHVDMAHHFWTRGLGVRWTKDDDKSHLNRARIQKVVELTQPKNVFHGHMHLRYTDDSVTPEGHRVEVFGLGRDGDKSHSYIITWIGEQDPIYT